uniref:Uncharacterized protein n=1 Tax=Romanomermis culicivorax TaxID=13658 RepID=A0A915HUN1_ROMCU
MSFHQEAEIKCDNMVHHSALHHELGRKYRPLYFPSSYSLSMLGGRICWVVESAEAQQESADSQSKSPWDPDLGMLVPIFILTKITMLMLYFETL